MEQIMTARISRISFATSGLTQFVSLRTTHALRAALCAATRPFGTLVNLDLDAFIAGADRWLTERRGADDLFALLVTASEGHHDTSCLMVTTHRVAIITPTSGTEISLSRADTVPGWHLRVDFGPLGSATRAAEVIAAAEAQVRIAHEREYDEEGAALDPSSQPAGALIEWTLTLPDGTLAQSMERPGARNEI